jgi:hypothetical protein
MTIFSSSSSSSSTPYKKDFHFVMVGTIKGESKEIVLENLKTIIKKNEEIKEISELHIFGLSH